MAQNSKGEVMMQPSLFDSVPLFRKNDHTTSRQAAEIVRPRRVSQATLLLQTYAQNTDGLTDEEAGDKSGLTAKPKCCYWKRCSELRAVGFITQIDTVRISSAGCTQMVCQITSEGVKALKAHQETL